MPFSFQQFPGDGVATGFPVAFPYLDRAHVKVFYGWLVDGTYTTLLSDGVGYTWSSSTALLLTVPPAIGQTLSIVRETPIDELLVQWKDASNMTEEALTIAALQWLYVLQELSDRGGVGGVSGAPQAIAVIDNLLSTSTTDALSANQGRILRGLIGAGGGTIIENVLTSIRTDTALSANMGRVLNEKILALQGDLANYKAVTDARLATLEGQAAGAVGNGDPVAAPIGSIFWQICGTPPLAQYIPADGSIKKRSVYSPLFNVIGTTYGVGDGVTTFELPGPGDLVNPYGARYCPYIKYGTRFVVTQQTWAHGSGGVSGPSSATAVFDSLANTLTRRTITAGPNGPLGGGNTVTNAMSANGKYLAGRGTRAGSQRPFAAISNGATWQEITMDQSATLTNIEQAVITPDGLWVLMTRSGALEQWPAWKLQSGVYTLVQANWGTATLYSENYNFHMAPNGLHFIMSGTTTNSIAQLNRLFYLDTITDQWVDGGLLPTDPGIGGAYLQNNACWAWHPTSNWAIAYRYGGGTIGKASLASRVGNAMQFLGVYAAPVYNDGTVSHSGRGVAWSDDGTRVAIAWTDGTKAGITFFTFNITLSTLTLLFESQNEVANGPILTGIGAIRFLPGSLTKIVALAQSSTAWIYDFTLSNTPTRTDLTSPIPPNASGRFNIADYSDDL